MLGSLGSLAGPWGAEMQVRISTIWENRQNGKDVRPQEAILSGFLANKGHRVYGGHDINVVSSTGVAGTRGGPIGV